MKCNACGHESAAPVNVQRFGFEFDLCSECHLLGVIPYGLLVEDAVGTKSLEEFTDEYALELLKQLAHYGFSTAEFFESVQKAEQERWESSWGCNDGTKSSLSLPEPLPIHNGSPPVWDLVVRDMKERDQSGREKYGTPLQAFNGRDGLIDAYQEALDLVVYLRQVIYERDGG